MVQGNEVQWGDRHRLRLLVIGAVAATLHVMGLGAPPAEGAAPQTVIDSGPQGIVGASEATFEFSAEGESPEFECRIDDGPFEPCTSPRGYSGLADGAHTFSVQTISGSGGAEPALPTQWNWVVDTSPPVLEWSGGLIDAIDGEEELAGPTYDLSIVAQDEPSTGSGVETIELDVDDGQIDREAVPCPQGGCGLTLDSVVRTDPLNPGEHVITVRAKDELGHTADRTLSIDISGNPHVDALPDTLPCTEPTEPVNFQFYSLGLFFEGMEASEPSRECEPPVPGDPARTNRVVYTYGEPPAGCEWELEATEEPSGTPSGGEEHETDQAVCHFPLQILSYPSCERVLADYKIEPGVPEPREDLSDQRGVPAAGFSERTRIELYAGMTTVAIDGADPAQVQRAIAAIRPEPPFSPPAVPSVVSAQDPNTELPAPVPGATSGELTCPV